VLRSVVTLNADLRTPNHLPECQQPGDSV